MTAKRITLWPPCDCDTSIVLERAAIDLRVIHKVSCSVCEMCWKVGLLPHGRQGLRASWRLDD
jgi:hypothetical protein